MAGCPTQDQLQSFLAGSLAGAEEEAICGHVDGCTTCQGVMELLVSGASVAPASRSAEPVPDEDVLKRLKAGPPGPGWSAPVWDMSDHAVKMSFATGTATDPSTLPEIPGYEVIAELGRGGMGIVYKARQIGLNRFVAVKMVFAGGAARDDALVRFRAEAAAVAALHHPNIVQVYEVGSYKGNPFFSMEYAASGTLRARLQKQPMSPRESAELIATLARAVEYAHERGIIHRDLKPANILFGKDAGGRPKDDTKTETVPGLTPSSILPHAPFRSKIADFGLAKRIDDELLTRTQTGRILGTPSYMAPEQASGKGNRAGPAVDIYALGAILYELLTGRPPFQGESFESTLNLILNAEPVAPRRLNASLPRDLETVCLKCLEKEPHRRYASAGALADDLGRFLAGQPVKVRPVGSLERGWRWCRRNPVLAALWGGFIGALLLGLAGVSWKWLEAESERKKVEAAEQKAREERDQANAARDESKRLTTGMLLDKGIDRAEKGAVAEGLFWMLEALKAAPEEDRGLRRAVRINLATWLPQTHGLRHTIPGSFLCVAISPDGQRIATGNGAGEVQFWDTATGRPQGPPMKAQGGGVAVVAFSPDGAFCVVGSPKNVQRFDVATGKQVGAPLAHPDFVHAAVFSPDGTRIATACEDGVVRLWDVVSGTLLGEPFRDEKTHPVCLAFNPDGSTLAVGTARSYDSAGASPGRGGRSLNTDPAAAHIVDLATGKQRGEALQHNGMVNQVAFDRDGRRLLTASSDGTARLWDAATGRPLGPTMTHAGEVLAANFTPDGAAIATGEGVEQVGSVRWWDAASGRPLAGSLPRHRGRVAGLEFSADGRTLVTIDAKKSASTEESELAVRIWQMARPFVRAPLVHTDDAVRSAMTAAWPAGVTVFSPDGRTALSWDSEGSVVRRWSVETGLPRGVPLRFPWPILTATFSSDGSRFAIACFDKPGAAGSSVASFCQVIETASGRVLFTLPHSNWVNSIAFAPDGTLLATGCYDRCVHLWDPATGKRVGKAWRQRDIVHGIAFSPDSRTLAVSHFGDDNGVYGTTLWDVAGRQLRDPELPFDTFHFSPDGRLLARLEVNNSSRLWDANTARPSEPALASSNPDECQVTFSADGRTLLTDGTDGTARLWDIASGRQLGLTMSHPHAVTARALSPDGQLLLLGYADGTARLWDAATQRPLGPPLRHAGPIRAAAFTPDGRYFLTAGADGTPRTSPVPAPLAEEDLERVRLRLEVRTGLTMTDSGYVTELGAPAWLQHRESLARLEGSAESAYTVAADAHIWSEARARDAEADGDGTAAAWHLDRLIALDPTDWQLYARRARVHSDAGRFDQANAEYAEALRRGRPEDLLNWSDHRAAECERAGRWNTALWYLDRAIAAEPKGWERYAARAAVDDKSGRAAERDADMERATALGADGPFLIKFGSDSARRNRWDKAIECYARAQERGPTMLIGWERHALALLRSSDLAGYRRLCKELIAQADTIADPGSANSAAWLLVLAPAAVDDYAPVVRLASVALQEVPGIKTRRPGTLNTLGAALYRAGRYREAIDRLNEAVTMKGDSTVSDRVFLALAHHQLGHTSEAKNWFDKIPAPTPAADSLNWDNLEIEILRREAEKVMRPLR